MKAHKHGFTLIEILVSIAITAVISIVIVQAFLITVRANRKAEIVRTIRQSGDYAMKRIKDVLYEATDLTCASGVVTLTDSDSNDVEIGQTDVSGVCRLYLQTNAAAPEYLTSDAITVDNCANQLFSCTLDGAGEVTSVTVTYTLLQSTGSTAVDDTAAVPYQTTVSIRNMR